MELALSSKSPDASYLRVCISILGVALAGLAGCSAPPDGAPPLRDSRDTAVETTAFTSSASTASTGVGACIVTDEGVVTSPDTCAGTGSGRLVVTLDSGVTCSSLFGVAMGATASNGFRKNYLFDSAPLSLRETYCVLDDVAVLTAASRDARAAALVTSLCGVAHVLDIARDCSASLPLSSVVPNAYAPPGAGLADAPLASPLGTDANGGNAAPRVGAATALTTPVNDPPEDDMGKNSCDVCVTAGVGRLFISLPPSFTNTPANAAGGSTLTVRNASSNGPDLYIVPPPRAQSFVVAGVDVAPNAKLTIYAPGVTPPPREPAE